MFRTSSVHHQERFVQAVFAEFGIPPATLNKAVACSSETLVSSTKTSSPTFQKTVIFKLGCTSYQSRESANVYK